MSQRTTLHTFLERAKKVHGEKYDYSKVIYAGVNKKVWIICPIHGKFEMRPKAHYDDRRGCVDCDNSGKSGFSDKSKWLKESKIIYLIEVLEEDERFLKFGVTKERELKIRFQKGQFPYNYNVLFDKRMKDGEKANKIEHELKLKYPKISYKPSLRFRGDTECLDYGIKEHLIKDLKKKIKE